VILEITAQAPACRPRRWSATTRSRWRSASIRRPASTTSARPRSTACPSSASRSNTASTTTSPTRRRRSACSRTSTLPGNQPVPQIQQSSLVGEVYRYQVVGPPHFGLTNLRTVQDWIVLRRLSTIPGVVQVNSWGGTTKEFEVEVDLQQARGLQRHAAAAADRAGQRQHQCRRPRDHHRPAVGQHPRRRPHRQRRATTI
jgi:hypothetical protein